MFAKIIRKIPHHRPHLLRHKPYLPQHHQCWLQNTTITRTTWLASFAYYSMSTPPLMSRYSESSQDTGTNQPLPGTHLVIFGARSADSYALLIPFAQPKSHYYLAVQPLLLLLHQGAPRFRNIATTRAAAPRRITLSCTTYTRAVSTNKAPSLNKASFFSLNLFKTMSSCI